MHESGSRSCDPKSTPHTRSAAVNSNSAVIVGMILFPARFCMHVQCLYMNYDQLANLIKNKRDCKNSNNELLNEVLCHIYMFLRIYVTCMLNSIIIQITKEYFFNIYMYYYMCFYNIIQDEPIKHFCVF